jgi:hypothetical protein
MKSIQIPDNSVPSKTFRLLEPFIMERCQVRLSTPPVALGIMLAMFPESSETPPTVAHGIL